MRFKKDIELGRFNAIYRAYPLLDSNNNCLWPGKYSTQMDIKKLKQTAIDEATWMREYMLTIIATEGQIIRPEWISFYSPNSNSHEYT